MRIERFIMFTVIVSVIVLFTLAFPLCAMANNAVSMRILDNGHLEVVWEPTLPDGEKGPIQAFSIRRADVPELARIDMTKLAWTESVFVAASSRSWVLEVDDATVGAMVIIEVGLIREPAFSGQGPAIEPLGYAGRIRLDGAERVLPVWMEPCESTFGSFIRGIGEGDNRFFVHGTVQPLASTDPVHAGMVIVAEKPLPKTIVMVGGIPRTLERRCPAGEFTAIAWPLAIPMNVPVTRFDHGESLVELFTVYLDANMQPMVRSEELTWGRHVHAIKPEREVTIQLPEGSVSLEGPRRSWIDPADLVIDAKPRYSPQRADNDVRVIYDASYETAHYKCWLGGTSGPWDGVTDHYPAADDVINAAVVRRGKTVYVSDSGISAATPITLWGPAPPGEERFTVVVETGWSSDRNCATIALPPDLPMGDYQLQVGTIRANYCTLYVLFDIAAWRLVNGGPLSDIEMSSWCYEDTAYVNSGRDGYGTAFDYLNYTYYGPSGNPGATSLYGYRGATDLEAGRDGGAFGQRAVELFASIHGRGAMTPLDAAVHVYQIVGQRITWTYNPWMGTSSSYTNYHDRVLAGERIYTSYSYYYTANELDVVTAEKTALGLGFTDRLTSAYIYNCGQCMNFGSVQTWALRSIGIPARTHYAKCGAGWIGSFHVWCDVAVPGDSCLLPSWWGGHWLKMDSCDVYSSSSVAHLEGHIGPTVFDGLADYLFNTMLGGSGPGYRGRYDLNEAYQGTSSTKSTHLDLLLKAGTTGDPQGSDLSLSISSSSCPFVALDSFADASGTGQSSYSYVQPGHHGYALNDSVWRGNGVFLSTLFPDEENIPKLEPGETVHGIIGGWGTAWFHVPPALQQEVTLSLTEGADRIKFYYRFDQPITSTGSRHGGLVRDGGPFSEVTIQLAGRDLFILVQGETNAGSPLGAQQVARFSLHRSALPTIPSLSTAGLVILLLLLGIVLSRRPRIFRDAR